MKSKLTILILTGLLLSNPVLAYDDQTTHPALTDEIIDFYNLFFTENRLTSQEKEWLVQSAMEEDTPPRWINHFYDPIYKVGWTGENTGIWPTMVVQYFSGKVLSSAEPVSSLDWLHNQQLQSEYGDFRGNRAWERAIYEYAKGNKKEAYYTLGYILHLIEDATVPDHTRNDTHAHELQYFTGDYGSPYEEFSKQYTRQTLDVVQKLKQNGYQPVILNFIDDYLISLAEYSNKYFFSKDTINNPKYEYPKIIKEENGYGYGKDKNGEEFELVNLETKIDSINRTIIKKYYLIYDDKDILVLNNYFTRLSREAVINGAGVIDLFYREGEKAKQNIDFIEKPPQETPKVSSLIDEFYAVFNFFSTVKEFAVSAFENISSKISPKIVSPQTQLAAFSLPEETVPILDIEQLVADDSSQRAVLGEIQSPTLGSGDLEDLQKTLDEAKIAVEIMEIQVAQIALAQAKAQTEAQVQIQTQTEQKNNLETGFPSLAALPYAGFGGGAAPTPTEPATNNASSSTSVELFTDSEAPAASDAAPPAPTLTIAECQNSLAASACLVATTTLNLSWSSAATDLNYFELSYASAAATTTSTTTATSTVLNLTDNAAYTFSLRARDQNGNWSEATTTAVEISAMPVIINEVAWMGTASSTEDEWIELYNRTNQVVNLNNWVLRVADNRPYIPLSETIPAKGYYLLERKDDQTISDLSADLVYGNDGADWALNNTGIETLILSHSSTTIDRTPSAEWPGGTISSYRTMERYNTDVSGEEISNWGTNITIIRNGKDAASSPLNGTPKARNSVNYLIAKGAATISNENIILTKANSPYLVNNLVQNFQNNAILTIESGVTIKFYNDAGMNFNNAAIKAQGATSSPVVFTSFYDDEYGGDTNADATSSAPSIGDWYGIDIVSGASGSILDRAIFRYAGKYYTPTSDADRVIVKIQDTFDIPIKNSVFEYSKAHGLVLVNSTSTVENSIFRNNNNYSEHGNGLLAASGNYSIKNNEFSQNQIGLNLSGAPVVIDANTFASNTQMAIHSYGLVGKFTRNTASQNGKNGIVLGGNLAVAGATSTLKADNIPYVLFEEDPAVPAGSALIIESGAIIKGSGKGLQVSGRLVLNGENYGDIVLTSLYDDTIGGNTDNAVNSPGPGNWPGITLSNNGSFQGRGFTLRYAGSQSYGGNDSAGLKMTTGSANIANALFDSNYPYGLYAISVSDLYISNSRFENHNYSGPWGTKAALAVFNSTTTLANVSFTNNLLGIASNAVSIWIASAVEFINNTATTSPGGLF